LAAVGTVTGAIFGLREVAPVLSLGVLYVFAVLLVALVGGAAYAISASIVSMVAFNWFFLPPRHTLALSDAENWVALAVYLATKSARDRSFRAGVVPETRISGYADERT
jgi:two-component system sensor histidine kinase KdpD